MSQTEPEAEVDVPKKNVAKTPIVMVLDISGSMRQKTPNKNGNQEKKVDQLQAALPQFKTEVSKNFKAEQAADVAIVTAGGDVEVETEFSGLPDFTPPSLSAGGGTPLCKGIVTAVNYMDDYRNKLRDNHVPLNKGLIWVLTDGRPTDEDDEYKSTGKEMWDVAQSFVRDGTEDGDLLFYGVGIGSGARIDKLEDLTSAAPDQSKVHVFELDDGMFQEFVKAVSESVLAESEDHVEDADEIGPQD